MTCRAKFKCVGVTKRVGWSGVEFVYDAQFMAVTGGGAGENQSFFAATPSGNINLSTVNADLFIPGKEYYIDFTLAE